MALEVFDARTDIRNLFITPEIRSRIMRFEPGSVSHGHTHDVGHEMFLVVSGQAEFTIAGQSAVLGAGRLLAGGILLSGLGERGAGCHVAFKELGRGCRRLALRAR